MTMTTTPSTITTITNPVPDRHVPRPDLDVGCRQQPDRHGELLVRAGPGLPIHVSDDLGRWTHLADAIDEAMAAPPAHPVRRGFRRRVRAGRCARSAASNVIVCTIARIDADAARRGGVSDDELEAAARAEGNFAITAERLEGPWSGPYWIDGAPKASTRTSSRTPTARCTGRRPAPAVDPQWEGQTEVWTQRIDPETWTLVDDGEAAGCGKTVIWRGYGVEAVWAEGPHLYRIDDYVYLMTAEGGTSFEHSEMVMRVFAPERAEGGHGGVRA